MDLLTGLLSPPPVLAQERASATPGRVLVSGAVTGGQPALHRVQHRPDAASPASPDVERSSGELTLELLDAAGEVLVSRRFDAAGPDPWHGGPAGGPATFALEVAAPASLHAVRVTAPGGLHSERTRSPGPPTIQADVSPDPASGAPTLRWFGQDPDGDEVHFDVYVRADGQGPWRGVAMGTTRTSVTLGEDQLPPGGQVTARLVASDGFNTTMTEVDLGPGAPLSVPAVIPARDARDVSVLTDVSIHLSAPLPETHGTPVLGSEAVGLTDEEGTQVFADVEYRPETMTILLAPVAPLRPLTEYTVTLAAGLEDPWGRQLGEDVTWSFTTGNSPETDADRGGAAMRR